MLASLEGYRTVAFQFLGFSGCRHIKVRHHGSSLDLLSDLSEIVPKITGDVINRGIVAFMAKVIVKLGVQSPIPVTAEWIIARHEREKRGASIATNVGLYFCGERPKHLIFSGSSFWISNIWRKCVSVATESHRRHPTLRAIVGSFEA